MKAKISIGAYKRLTHHNIALEELSFFSPSLSMLRD
jgi:hypothetical protein